MFTVFFFVPFLNSKTNVNRNGCTMYMRHTILKEVIRDITTDGRTDEERVVCTTKFRGNSFIGNKEVYSIRECEENIHSDTALAV